MHVEPVVVGDPDAAHSSLGEQAHELVLATDKLVRLIATRFAVPLAPDAGDEFSLMRPHGGS